MGALRFRRYLFFGLLRRKSCMMSLGKYPLGESRMRAVRITAAVAAAVVAAGGVAWVTAATTPHGTAMAPDKVRDFELTDTTRMGHELYYFKYAPAIVLMSQTD